MRVRTKATRSERHSAGFTLIEVMIVVAIVAILAMVATPSYRNYILRGALVDGTTLLSTASGNMERYFQDNRTYEAVGANIPPCSAALPLATRTQGTFVAQLRRRCHQLHADRHRQRQHRAIRLHGRSDRQPDHGRDRWSRRAGTAARPAGSSRTDRHAEADPSPRHRRGRDPGRGFTLIELLTTLSVLAVLIQLSLPSFTIWISNTRVRTVADTLQNGVRLAQAEAVRRNRQVVLSFTNGTPVARRPGRRRRRQLVDPDGGAVRRRRCRVRAGRQPCRRRLGRHHRRDRSRRDRALLQFERTPHDQHRARAGRCRVPRGRCHVRGEPGQCRSQAARPGRCRRSAQDVRSGPTHPVIRLGGRMSMKPPTHRRATRRAA